MFLSEDTSHNEEAAVLRINLATMDETVTQLASDAAAGHGFTMFTLNLDHLVKLRVDRAFRAAYQAATYVSADGWPIVYLAKRKGAKLERTTGADMVEPLCAEAARRGIPVFLFGSSSTSLETAATRLRRRYPELIVAGMESPAYGFDPGSAAAEAAADRMAASGARLCFLALGAPKQELFADMALRRHPHLGFLCVGAALDFIAGHQERAPRLMQQTGTEWLFRLMTNPRRLAGRYARSALLFARLLLRDSFGLRNSDFDVSLTDLPK
jgi:exopolysaccharide biosynthesis WecB/TagA/CpsF family protein